MAFTDESKGTAETRNPTTTERRVWMTALENRLAETECKLNSRRKKLFRAILNDPEDTYFLSSRALAKRYEVDTATIVRSIQALGYKRYADFAADLRSHFINRITPYALMKSAAREDRSVADHVQHSLEMEIQNLTALRSSLDTNRVVDVAKRIDASRRIIVVGVDFAAPLAQLLAYGLVTLGHDAEAPVGSTGNLQQKAGLLRSRDLLIAFSFGRCLRDTVETVLRARNSGVPTFGITDSEQSPIARFCDSFWITSIANPSFNGSYVAPLAAIDAILVACAHTKPERTLAILRRKEQESRSGHRWYADSDFENSDGHTSD
jgi:DNA-binding MurR/RpiR family transcriptional regulator